MDPAAAAHQRRVLSALFFASGVAGLVYQVVWQRLLGLFYGVGAVSSALIVSVTLLGLGLGALLGGGLAARSRRPLHLYVGIEIALGLFGAASLPLIGIVGEGLARAGPAAALGLVTGFLAVPTTLMGATLPLMVEALSRSGRDLTGVVGRLYFTNTLGAAAGALLASYGLISLVGLDGAIWAAVGINAGLAGGVGWWARRGEASTGGSGAGGAPAEVGSLGRATWALVFVGGALAIGYEVVWIRIVTVLVKASPYAFSTVLAVYLGGIAGGSRWVSRRRPGEGTRALYFGLQAAAGGAAVGIVTLFVALTRHTPLGAFTRASFLVRVHPAPHWPDLATAQGWLNTFASIDIFLWPALFVLLPTFCFGAAFPLAAALAARPGASDGGTVGGTTFWNTMGNVVGGLGVGFGLLPALGTEHTVLLLGGVSLLFGLGVDRLGGWPLPGWGRVGLVVGAAALLAWGAPGPGELYRALHPAPGPRAQVWVDEGVDGVVVSRVEGEQLETWIGGLPHGGRPGIPFYGRAIEALDRAPAVAEVLIVGLGTGSFLEVALATPGVERVTVVELSPTLLRHLRRVPALVDLLDDPRVRLVVDDGRRHLLREEARYDVILIDPLRSTTSLSNNLYSVEFFTLARARLRPGGVFLVWMDEDRVLPRTVATAFPQVALYESFALASERPLPPPGKRRPAILAGLPPAAREALPAEALVPRGDRATILTRTAGAPINADLHPHCEYYLGLPFTTSR